jgi:predicted Zn-dependent peptidase
MAIAWQIGELENGLRVVTTPVPTAQSVSVCIFVGVGSRMEERRTNGLSHYVEHLLFKGSVTRPNALAISQAIEGAGGVLNAFTNKELTGYWAQVPYDRLELALDVLADMVTHPLLDAAEIDRERTVIQQEIRRAHDQPAHWTSELLLRAVYGDQPLGWPIAGSEESVQGMTRQDLVDHVGHWHVPENIVVSVAGNTEHDQVLSLAQEKMGRLQRSPFPSFLPVQPGPSEGRIQAESRDIDQSNLAIALPALPRKDPSRFALAILNSVLGRGMSSRLFKEVRERRGLAYSVGSSVSRHHDSGLLAISAGVSPQNLGETAKVVLEEVFRLTGEPVPDEEMTRARDYTVGTFRLGLETTMALAHTTGDSLLTTGEIEEIDEVVGKLQAITADDVQKLAKRLFHRDDVAMAIVGPQASSDVLQAALSR